MPEKLTHEEFILRAMETLRDEKHKGLHTVYSGFNTAFREYFDGEDPVAAVKAVAERTGKYKVVPRRGGAAIFFVEDAPEGDASAQTTLKKMNLTKE